MKGFKLISFAQTEVDLHGVMEISEKIKGVPEHIIVLMATITTMTVGSAAITNPSDAEIGALRQRLETLETLVILQAAELEALRSQLDANPLFAEMRLMPLKTYRNPRVIPWILNSPVQRRTLNLLLLVSRSVGSQTMPL